MFIFVFVIDVLRLLVRFMAFVLFELCALLLLLFRFVVCRGGVVLVCCVVLFVPCCILVDVCVRLVRWRVCLFVVGACVFVCVS